MATISNEAFKSPVIGIDPITKGTFTITWAQILYDYDFEEEEIKNTRASGNILVEGYNNPLYDIIKADITRAQGLIASVMFGIEKKFIRFSQLSNYEIVEDDLIKEIEFSLVFDILDNLEYLENIEEYKENHSL